MTVGRLLLLVGGNPLPNAVAAWHLLARGGVAALLYTDETEAVAHRLAALLETWGHTPLRVRVRRASPHSVYAGALEAFGDARSGESVGLHYTGGTKSMAVHAYRACLAISQAKGIAVRTSYLDAGTLRIEVDPEDPSAPGGGSSVYTGLEPALSVEGLMRLHGWRLMGGHPAEHAPRLPSLAGALGRAHSDREGQRHWGAWKGSWREAWKRAVPRFNRRGPGRTDPRALAALRDTAVAPLPGSAPIAPVRDALRDAGVDPSRPGPFGSLADALGEEPTVLGAWLDGAWLESHVLVAVQEVASAQGLAGAAAGLYVEATGTFSDARRPFFEFDVAALRGSQLFAFSCTVATANGTLKTKLFELQARARQFGGDQARVALVCPHGRPDAVEAEARSALGAERLRVFGQQDLHPDRLPAAIGGWVGGQTGTPD